MHWASTCAFSLSLSLCSKCTCRGMSCERPQIVGRNVLPEEIFGHVRPRRQKAGWCSERACVPDRPAVERAKCAECSRGFLRCIALLLDLIGTRIRKQIMHSTTPLTMVGRRHVGLSNIIYTNEPSPNYFCSEVHTAVGVCTKSLIRHRDMHDARCGDNASQVGS